MKKHKIITTILVFIIILSLSIIVIAYRSLNFDYDNSKFIKNVAPKYDIVEKVYKTNDGSHLSYFEGPDSGPNLLLIHGQMVSKEDYAKVLPKLSKHFHIYAIDYYGHGKSSKDPSKYSNNAITKDIISFMKDVIKEKTIVTGHSSGALIASNIASKAKTQVSGLILEDGPFFATEKGRAEKTFSYLEFKTISDYLDGSKNETYTQYYLKHTYMKNMFNKDGNNNWKIIVQRPYEKRIKKNSSKMPIVWYYPPKIGLNQLIDMTKNLQDKTGQYDLRFGKSFYDFTWFNGYDQTEVLSSIECPTYVMHVAPSSVTKPSYYDNNGILISAMDEKDADKVHKLIKHSKLKTGYKSDHDIHVDKPNDFIKTVFEFEKYMDKETDK